MVDNIRTPFVSQDGKLAVDFATKDLGAQLHLLKALLVNSSGTPVESAGLPLAAGEAHIGQVGGTTVNLRPTITVDASPDYSDGDDIFGKLSLPVARVAGGSGYLTRLSLRSRINITVGTFLHIFDSDPSASTFTKNSAMVLNSADQAKILWTFSVLAADWVAPKGVSPWYTVALVGVGAAIPSLAYQLASGVNLYAAYEADGTINFGSTDDIAMVVASENN